MFVLLNTDSLSHKLDIDKAGTTDGLAGMQIATLPSDGTSLADVIDEEAELNFSPSPSKPNVRIQYGVPFTLALKPGNAFQLQQNCLRLTAVRGCAAGKCAVVNTCSLCTPELRQLLQCCSVAVLFLFALEHFY